MDLLEVRSRVSALMPGILDELNELVGGNSTLSFELGEMFLQFGILVQPQSQLGEPVTDFVACQFNFIQKGHDISRRHEIVVVRFMTLTLHWSGVGVLT